MFFYAHLGYLSESFLFLQNQISNSLINYWAPGEGVPEIELQRFPYPKYIEDALLPALTSFVSTVVLLSYVYTAINTIKVVSAEKELKMKVIKSNVIKNVTATEPSEHAKVTVSTVIIYYYRYDCASSSLIKSRNYYDNNVFSAGRPCASLVSRICMREWICGWTLGVCVYHVYRRIFCLTGGHDAHGFGQLAAR
jgi:hypothetical protein